MSILEFLMLWLFCFLIFMGILYIAKVGKVSGSLIVNGNEIIIDNSSYKCQMIKTLREE